MKNTKLATCFGVKGFFNQVKFIKRRKVLTHSKKMTTNLQQGTLLDVLKKKMRQTKEEMERYKDECEEYNRKLQLEAMRREEVRESLNRIEYVVTCSQIYAEDINLNKILSEKMPD